MRLLRIFISTFIIIWISASAFGQTASIHVNVENIQGNEGLLVLGIFDNEDDFKNKTNPFQAIKLNFTGNEASHTFSDLPLGKYGVAVFHDANADGKLNTKSMKIPTEGVGTSGKMQKMRAPKFEDTAFKLIRDTTIVIQMVYPTKR